jgi:hypothetical protein
VLGRIRRVVRVALAALYVDSTAERNLQQAHEVMEEGGGRVEVDG